MGTCLVTSLHDAVMDDSILKLGEMSFKVLDNVDAISSITINRTSTEPYPTLTIVGDGHFTDVNGEANLGKTQTTSTPSANQFYFSKGNYTVILKNKYGLRGFVVAGTSASRDNFEFNLSSFAGCSELSYIGLSNSETYGSLKDILTLHALGTLNIDNTHVSGDTSDVASLTNLATFYYANTNITGTWPLT